MSRFVVSADVARFYHALYTHSIPWAIHGKPAAKAQRDNSLYGNILDTLIRNAQDQQTVGIPVGPDTSLAIAEVVLARVDERLASEGFRNAFRIIDDYEIGVTSLGDGERALAILEGGLHEYELHLNGPKTTIQELPTSLDSIWVNRIVTPPLRSKGVLDKHEILEIFDLAFEQSRLFSDDPVITTAVQKVGAAPHSAEAAEVYAQMLLQCLGVSPSTIRFIVPELVRLDRAGMLTNTTDIAAALNSIVMRKAPLAHNSEVAWAITGLMAIEQPLVGDAARHVADNDDMISGLCLLDARARGLVEDEKAVDSLRRYMVACELAGTGWMLAYEAANKGWLTAETDCVREVAAFQSLREAGVEFYSPGRVAKGLNLGSMGWADPDYGL